MRRTHGQSLTKVEQSSYAQSLQPVSRLGLEHIWQLCLVLGLTLLATSASLALSVSPPEAVGSLFAKSPQKYLCTATVVQGQELGLELESVLLTAAHCVESGLEHDSVAQAWLTKRDYQVSFDGQSFFDVTPYRVGFAEEGFDVAVLSFKEQTPDITPLRMGAWDSVEYGTPIQNYANPMGMGIQYFTGSVTMLDIQPSPVNSKKRWHYNAVASVQVGPGSSGSLILNEAQEYIGVLSSVMEARFGSPFTIFIPQWKVESFLSDASASRPIGCDYCAYRNETLLAVNKMVLAW